MRNIKKSSTLESKFPLLAVEQGCIISKDGDITVAYEVTLPEIFTVTSQEYESAHAAWCKAIKVLPDYSIVHKQDWFVKESGRRAQSSSLEIAEPQPFLYKESGGTNFHRSADMDFMLLQPFVAL